jgi:ribosomal protein S18 acetylase RimI-like enzyme
MKKLEASFAALGCDSLRLEVAVNNRPGLSFYKKHGFIVIKSLRRYYPGGLDGLLMTKKLSTNLR